MREDSEHERIETRLDKIESHLSHIKILLIILIVVCVTGFYGFPDSAVVAKALIVICAVAACICLLLLVLEKIVVPKAQPNFKDDERIQRILREFESTKEEKPNT